MDRDREIRSTGRREATSEVESDRKGRRSFALPECLMDPQAECSINRALDWLAMPGPMMGCMAPAYQLFGAAGFLVGLFSLFMSGGNGGFPISMSVPAVVGGMVLFDGSA